MEEKIKIGLFRIELDTYWSQFDGLFDKLKSFQQRIKNRLEQSYTEVVGAGMVDNPDKAIATAGLFQKSREWFSISNECTSNDIEQTALSSVALDRLAEKFRLGALAYYYEGEGEVKSRTLASLCCWKRAYYFKDQQISRTI